MGWYLSAGSSECNSHPVTCHYCNERWTIFSDTESLINKLEGNEQLKTELNENLQKIQSNLAQYISHIVRSVHQRRQFQLDVQNLQPGEVIVVVDYMMKLLFQKLYEPQNEWFGKKGVSLHGTMFIYRNTSEGPLMTEYHDYYSEDDSKNCFFSASC